MSEYDGSIYFKDWLPDQPDLGNPGLTEALGVVPLDSTYKSYYPLATSQNAFSNSAVDGVAFKSNGGANTIYVGTALGNIYKSIGSPFGTDWTDNALSSCGSITSFLQYEDLVIAASALKPLQYQSTGSLSGFATLGSASGTAPVATVVGRIGQFVFAGNAGLSNAELQWCGIDSPLSWPTPGSATAIAQQAGSQTLHVEYGHVTGIFGGDQIGIILQDAAITRVTYVGGDVVFHFDTIATGIGMENFNAAILVKNVVYFMCSKGFFATDGVTVENIGDEKVNRYFQSIRDTDVTRFTHARCGVDWARSLLYWLIPRTGDLGAPNGVFIYNISEKRWSHAVDSISLIVHGMEREFYKYGMLAIGSDKKVGSLTGTPITATLTTGELEPNAGGYSTVQGVKPLADQTLNGITVAMGTRNDRTSAVSYTAEQTANSRSGFANFRTSAKYHRARLMISGTFNAAQGLEYQAVPDGFT